jgi:hypothetical protein
MRSDMNDAERENKERGNITTGRVSSVSINGARFRLVTLGPPVLGATALSSRLELPASFRIEGFRFRYAYMDK